MILYTDKKPTSLITFSGKEIELLNPSKRDIEIIDISKGLSQESRWGAQTPYFYSVATHSLFVAGRFFNPREKLLALLHDASEAYIKDIIRPLKMLLPEYKEIQTVWDNVIFERFNLNDVTEEEKRNLKHIDMQVEEYEYEKLFVQKSESLKFGINSQFKKFNEVFADTLTKYYQTF